MAEFVEVRVEAGPIAITGIERRGAGAPIVLLHGVGGNAFWFKPLMTALGGRHAIALDMPGHGGSGDAPGWDLDSIAELMFVAAGRLVNGPVIWGGHSWGGKVAAIIAGTHPAKAEALLMLDPTPAAGIPIPAEMFVDLTFGGELGPWGSLEEARDSVRKLPQYSNWNEDLARAFERGVVSCADGSVRARISRETLIAICAAAAEDYSGTIRRVSCPSLFVVADESLALQEAFNFPLLPDAARAVVRSNHWIMSGNPAETNRAVESWLDAREPVLRRSELSLAS